MNPFQSPQYQNYTNYKPGPIIVLFAMIGIVLNICAYVFSMLWPLLIIGKIIEVVTLPWIFIALCVAYNLTFSYYLFDFIRRNRK